MAPLTSCRGDRGGRILRACSDAGSRGSAMPAEPTERVVLFRWSGAGNLFHGQEVVKQLIP